MDIRRTIKLLTFPPFMLLYAMMFVGGVVGGYLGVVIMVTLWMMMVTVTPDMMRPLFKTSAAAAEKKKKATCDHEWEDVGEEEWPSGRYYTNGMSITIDDGEPQITMGIASNQNQECSKCGKEKSVTGTKKKYQILLEQIE